MRERGGGVNALNACGSAPATGGSGPRGCGSDGDRREGGGDEQGWGEERRVMEGTGDGWGRGTDGDKAGMGVSR